MAQGWSRTRDGDCRWTDRRPERDRAVRHLTRPELDDTKLIAILIDAVRGDVVQVARAKPRLGYSIPRLCRPGAGGQTTEVVVVRSTIAGRHSGEYERVVAAEVTDRQARRGHIECLGRREVQHWNARAAGLGDATPVDPLCRRTRFTTHDVARRDEFERTFADISELETAGSSTAGLSASQCHVGGFGSGERCERARDGFVARRRSALGTDACQFSRGPISDV